MSDAPDETRPLQSPDDVRAAADALKGAIEAHLAAVLARAGEEDPNVQAAYDALRAAAEAYDDALFEVYDEVTPFEFADAPGSGPTPGVDDELDEVPQTLTVLLRRDYDVVDADALLTSGRAARTEADGLPGEDDEDDEHVGAAIYHLVHTYGVDGLHARAEDIGLEPTGGTMWLLDDVAGDIDTDAFDGVDEEKLRLRLDELYPSDPPM